MLNYFFIPIIISPLYKSLKLIFLTLEINTEYNEAEKDQNRLNKQNGILQGL